MAKARRAQPRRARVVVPIVAAIAAVGVVGGVWQLTGSSRSAGPDVANASSAATSASTLPTDASSETSPSVSPTPSGTSLSPSPNAAPSTSASAVKALQACQAKVAAGDDVLAAAKDGVGDWASHVQAQTDQFDGKISAAKMQKTFAKTRLAGPDDVTAYDKAVKTYDDTDGSCAAQQGASSAVKAKLASCQKREQAQKTTLAAADKGMDDWKNHLGDMRHSRMTHVANAEQIWLDAWKAAPKNIKAWKSATAAYAKAPSC